ncbi:hypothetical protein [Streptosporangium sp. NPDC051022]|uniref:hypothetical protein n=1 Tax=Streptosporangium sp. NPDC051022 TaxID=3155752 RepID=UPI00343F3AC5
MTARCPAWCEGHTDTSNRHAHTVAELDNGSIPTTVRVLIASTLKGPRVAISSPGAGAAFLEAEEAKQFGQILISRGLDPELGQALVAAAALLGEA